MDWIPKNKHTGRVYRVVNDAKKKSMEENPHTAGKFSFSPSRVAAPVTAKAPTTEKKERKGAKEMTAEKVEDPTKVNDDK